MNLPHKLKMVKGIEVRRALPSSQKGKQRQLRRLADQFKDKQLTAVLYQRANMELKSKGQTLTKNQMNTTSQAFENVDKVVRKIRKLEK